LFDARFRTAFDRVASPAGRALRRTGLSPDHLTAAGILISLPAAWAIGSGHLIVGMLLIIGSALPDLFDGSLAKASGRTSARGAFFDSVGDRVSDTVVLGGFAWYVQSRFGGHAALVPLAVLGASQLVSYVRAKADALGIDAKNGLMERAERVFALCFALQFSADMMPLLWMIFALSMVTVVQRFATVWRLADRPPKQPPAAVVVRWRAWREERAAWRQQYIGRETSAGWWARAPRGGQPGTWDGLLGPSTGSSTGSPAEGGRGLFAVSRRPGGARARGGARGHERRWQRRQVRGGTGERVLGERVLGERVRGERVRGEPGRAEPGPDASPEPEPSSRRPWSPD
jgi:CDP-diacylglycerol--glycerol-3-phosphate 3-phosphatidyltransferase